MAKSQDAPVSFTSRNFEMKLKLDVKRERERESSSSEEKKIFT